MDSHKIMSFGSKSFARRLLLHGQGCMQINATSLGTRKSGAKTTGKIEETMLASKYTLISAILLHAPNKQKKEGVSNIEIHINSSKQSVELNIRCRK